MPEIAGDVGEYGSDWKKEAGGGRWCPAQLQTAPWRSSGEESGGTAGMKATQGLLLDAG